MKTFYLYPTLIVLGLLAMVSADEFSSNTTPGVVSNTAPTRLVVTPTVEQVAFDPVAAARGNWFMSRDRERAFRGIFPRTSDPDINVILTDPDLILYTNSEMPLARQIWSNVSSGIHSINYDISGGADSFGRGSAHEFPWKDAAGTHRVPNSELVEVRAMLLPKVNGTRQPIVYWYTKQDYARGMFDSGRTKIEWTYPHGTVFLELLGRKLSNGTTMPFELRVRVREPGGWSVDVFRPFVVSTNLSAALASIDADESQRIALRPIIRSETMHDSTHTDKQAINLTANYEQLPTYSNATVMALLRNRTFQSALGEEWRDGVVIPAGGINPAGYRAIMEVDSQSCARCHESTNRHVSHFQLRRDWYGNVRGSDHILSFHIFAPSCVSHDGMNKAVVYRRELVRWNLLEPFDLRKHTSTFYTALD